MAVKDDGGEVVELKHGIMGRRRLDKPELSLPKIGTTEDSVRRYLAAVAEHLATGALDPRYADSMIAAAKGALAAMRDKAKRTEIDELKSLLKAAQTVHRAGVAREAAERSHAPGPADGHSPGDPGSTSDK